MKIREKIRYLVTGMLLPVMIGNIMPITSLAAGAGAEIVARQDSGSIRYYTEGMTVHSVKWDKSNEEFNAAYGQYLTGNVNVDGNTITGATGGNEVSEKVGSTKLKESEANNSRTYYGDVNYDQWAIVPFNDDVMHMKGNGLAVIGFQFSDKGYMQASLAMQDAVQGETRYQDYFENQEIEYDSEGNVVNKPVILECNGIISMLSYDGAIRDQYSLQSPQDGTWFLGGVNAPAGYFYGHQYTLEDGMVPGGLATTKTGGWYGNKDGLASEQYNNNNNMLMTHLRHNGPEFEDRMHIRFFKTYLPVLNYTRDGSDDSETPPDIWEVTGEYGRDFPEVYTYNTSDEFNLGQGIPSGESFTNGFLTNKWFGTYGWGKTYVIKQETTVEHPIRAKYQERHEDTYTDSDGDEHTYVYYTTEYYDVCPTVTTSREAYYYGIRSADIYEFKNADVSNGSYGVPPHYENPSSVPVTMDINESSVSTYETIYKTNVGTI